MTPRNVGRREEARARAVYRWLARAYPRRIRRRDGAEMEEAFIALLKRDVASLGTWGRVRCWAGALWDTAARAAAVRWHDRRRSEHGQGGGEMVGTILADVRFALRSMARRPAFAVTAIGTLALGIGANVAIFTVVEGFLLSPLPYERPEELITVWAANPEMGWTNTDVNPADAWDWRERTPSVADLAVFTDAGFNLTGDGPPELVSGVRASPNLLGLLGRDPVLGRDLRDDDVGEGRDGVAILADGFWERRFGRDRDVLGSTITLNGRAVTVVGILSESFRFLDERIDLIVPLDPHPSESDRGRHYANAIARLRSGASLDQARRELTDVAAQLAVEYPETNEGWTVEVVSTHADLVGDVARQAALVLLGAVGFILLMACVNVANLLLARAGSRRQEMSVRAALGAGRSRVVRQLLTESLVLAAAGGSLGVLLAVWGYRAIVAALPSTLPPVFQFGMDASVLVFAVAVSAGAAVLFGLAPSLSATRDMMHELRNGGRGGRSRGSGRLSGFLVVLQTTLAVVLLIGGGLLMKSLTAMRTQDFGFDPENVIAMRVSPPTQSYPEAADARAFWDAVESRVAQLPGVVAVGTTQSHPLMGSNWGTSVRIAGQDTPEDAGRSVRVTYASPGLFEALRLRVLRGRALQDTDGPDAPSVALVNETFVRRYLAPEQDPLSASIVVGDGSGLEMPIVGVVHDVVERAVDRPPEPSIYASLAQRETRTRSLVVRTAGDPGAAVPEIQEAVWSVDPAIPLYEVETMGALVERRLGGFLVIGYLMATFAILSLVLGAVGIYGVTAQAAGRRTGEIGLRLAMGAERSQVVRMVVRQGATRAVLGLGIGLVLAFLSTGAMSSILVGVRRGDPATFVGVTAVLGLVSLLALYIPARRASRVDPVRALASE